MSKTRAFVCLAITVVLATSLFSSAQTVTDSFQVSYFNNATSTKFGDQVIRIVNPGLQGSRLEDNSAVCANIYVYDSRQKMQACCSCKVEANHTVTLSLAKDLLRRAVNATTPSSGVIKMVSSAIKANFSSCNPTSLATAPNLRATMEHLDLISPAGKVPFDSPSSTPFLSVAAFESSDFSMYELENLIAGCGHILPTNACSCGT